MRVRGLVVLVVVAAACADAPEPRPETPLPDIASETSGTIALVDSDMSGFPTVAGLSQRDYTLEDPTNKEFVTKFYKLRHVQGSTIVPIVQQWLPPPGRVIDVPQQNLLIFTVKKDLVETLDRILEQIDRVPPQVEIEAKVIEIRRGTGYEFGFELHVDRTPASNTAFRRFDGAFNSTSFLNSLRPGAFPFQGAQVNWAAIGKAQEVLGDFDYIVRALEREGYAEVLSAPRVVVSSGQPAVLSAKTKEPVLDTNIVNTNLQYINTRYEIVGVELQVTPLVVGTEAILLNAKPAVSSVVSFVDNPVGGVPIPRIAERTAQTQVAVRNGEILVIGGLFEKRIRKDTTKIPVIGHIPFIGKLFSSIDDFEEKTDVIFIVKLRILSAIERADARLGAIPTVNPK